MNKADTDDVVLYEIRDGVAIITLNQPERRNPWGGDLTERAIAQLDSAETDPQVRVIVLTANGSAFCVGADIGGLGQVSNDLASGAEVGSMTIERHPHFLTSMRKPVIAAINGACAGIGLVLALMCDVRFAAAGAKFTTAFARRGLTAEYGISWILPRLIGWANALDLLLSGRSFSAEEAAELGLVKEVVPAEYLITQTLTYATDLAVHCAPSSLEVIKGQLYGETLFDLTTVSAHAEQLMHESMTRPDFIEGITAFFEKRPPNFPSLGVTSG